MKKISYLVTFCLSVFFLTFPILTRADADEEAIFAGGSFWSMQADFDKVPGVQKTIVGYTGGRIINPTYEQVSRGKTGHYEAIQIIYDPSKISYQKLLDIFWHNTDPTNIKGQFCDKGNQYRAAIFYRNEKQKNLAAESKQQLIKSGKFKEIVTPILAASNFYPAEEIHQKYYQKNPFRYRFYRFTCGRSERLGEIWHK
jgi:peptide-methionine (S)-S-oxide reductase